MDEEQALYRREGDAFVGSNCTQSSWSPGAQAGGAVLALLGHVLEDVPTLTPMSLSRMTVDLVRPVPIGEPLWIDHLVIREGKIIQVVDSIVRSAEQRMRPGPHPAHPRRGSVRRRRPGVDDERRRPDPGAPRPRGPPEHR